MATRETDRPLQRVIGERASGQFRYPQNLHHSGGHDQSDSIAGKRFQVAKDDPRRLHGAVIHVLQKRYMAGDTVVAEPDLRKSVAKLLHSDDDASSALLLTFRNGGFVRFGDRQFQLRGVWAKDTLNARTAPPQPT